MSVLVLFRQVTLDDVIAQADAQGLDVLAFLDLVKDLLEETERAVDADDEVNLLRGLLELESDELRDADVDERWLDLRDRLGSETSPRKFETVLVHPARSASLRRLYRARNRYGRLVMPLARTLRCSVPNRPWDAVLMPSDTLGTKTSVDELVEDLARAILSTPGGAQYLGNKRVERSLAVMATTVAAVLNEPRYCQRTKRTGQRPLVRPDMYEMAARSMGLEPHFQIVRRLLEVDHEEHLPHQVAWPTPHDPIRALGFLEQRGDHLTLGNLPPFQWL